MRDISPSYDYGNISPASSNWPLWWEQLRDRKLNHVKSLNWESSIKPDFDTQFDGAALLGSSINADNSIDYLFYVDDCLVHLWWSQDDLSVYLAAKDRKSFDSLETRLRLLYPSLQVEVADEVRLKFWFMAGQGSGAAYNRMLAVPKWEEISTNYGQVVRDEMERLTGSFRPSHGGQLLLWQGSPGTGKTFAIRSLVKEWSSWCDANYIVDPEQFFGNSNYMMQVLLNSDNNYGIDIEGGEQRWKLVILEDSGELLSHDAQSRTGQALSRLLNISDGLIGQGLKVLILITTNEEMASLHEAVSRPGRCASKIVFPRLSKDEAIAWAANNNLNIDVDSDMSLAELYGVLEGFAKTPEQIKRVLGFGQGNSTKSKTGTSKGRLGFRPREQTSYTEPVPAPRGEEEYLYL